MYDLRIDQLADLLLDHSTQLQAGEKFLIEAFDLPNPALVCRLVEGAVQRKAIPLVTWKSNEVLRSLYRTATIEGMQLAAQFERSRIEAVQDYI
jgi:aminopeptidase